MTAPSCSAQKCAFQANFFENVTVYVAASIYDVDVVVVVTLYDQRNTNTYTHTTECPALIEPYSLLLLAIVFVEKF